MNVSVLEKNCWIFQLFFPSKVCFAHTKTFDGKIESNLLTFIHSNRYPKCHNIWLTIDAFTRNMRKRHNFESKINSQEQIRASVDSKCTPICVWIRWSSITSKYMRICEKVNLWLGCKWPMSSAPTCGDSRNRFPDSRTLNQQKNCVPKMALGQIPVCSGPNFEISDSYKWWDSS